MRRIVGDFDALDIVPCVRSQYAGLVDMCVNDGGLSVFGEHADEVEGLLNRIQPWQPTLRGKRLCSHWWKQTYIGLSETYACPEVRLRVASFEDKDDILADGLEGPFQRVVRGLEFAVRPPCRGEFPRGNGNEKTKDEDVRPGGKMAAPGREHLRC